MIFFTRNFELFFNNIQLKLIFLKIRCPTLHWNVKYGGCEFILMSSVSNRCLSTSPESDEAITRRCKDNEYNKWVFSEGQLINLGRDSCLYDFSSNIGFTWSMKQCQRLHYKKWRILSLSSHEDSIVIQDTKFNMVIKTNLDGTMEVKI